MEDAINNRRLQNLKKIMGGNDDYSRKTALSKSSSSRYEKDGIIPKRKTLIQVASILGADLEK